MQLNTVIFDMDGLLIDSEPLWQEAGEQMLQQFGVSLTDEQYRATTGLRTPEWVDHWFRHFNIDGNNIQQAIALTESMAIEKIYQKGIAMPGADYILEFFKKRNFNMGLASSSPMRLIDVVIDKLKIRQYFDILISAEGLPFGKPHPQVFLDCAAGLLVSPVQCICFEDSFNGLIAAKAAKMKCVIVPPQPSLNESKWKIADIHLASLKDFDESFLERLM